MIKGSPHPPDQPLRAVLALIEEEPPAEPDLGMADRLSRLCRAAVRALPASGVGLSLMASQGVRGMSVASGAQSELVEELQFTLGEGPCRDAYRSQHAVLAGDLTQESTRWPAYSPAAQDHGVAAVFAFPLSVGMAPLGILDVYRERPGQLPPPALQQAYTFAQAAVTTILDEVDRSGADGVLGDLENQTDLSHLDEAVTNRLELYQAQGMITVQLGIGLEEAMARLRAYAFARDLRLGAVAHDIVTRKLTLSPDD